MCLFLASWGPKQTFIPPPKKTAAELSCCVKRVLIGLHHTMKLGCFSLLLLCITYVSVRTSWNDYDF